MVKYPFETNSIYVGDCKKVLKEFPDESVDLIYLDPPFFSNRNYEVIWEDGSELRAFEDRWKGRIQHYIEWMEERIELMHHVLKKTGCLYLHCDWHASHYLKVALDDIFDRENFQNEIIWHYKTGGASKKRFARKHDSLLFYSKSEEFLFNPQKQKSYTKSNSREAGTVNYGQGTAEFHEDDEGVYNLVYMHDVWNIPYLNSQAKERLGYPTQKPKRLLKRIIKASSNEGDIVLDPFCGCGTTIAAAEKLNRNWIGIDVSPTAAKVMKNRMDKRRNVKPNIVGVPQRLEQTKAWIKNLEPIDLQNYVVKCYEGKQQKRKRSDMGIDGWTKDGKPMQIKQSKGTRPALDSFETAIRRDDKKKGVFVAQGFSKGVYEEVARLKNKGNLKIKLETLDELVDRMVDKGELPALTFSLQDSPKIQETPNGD